MGSCDCGMRATKREYHMNTGKLFLGNWLSVLANRGATRWRPAQSGLAPWLIGASLGWLFLSAAWASNPIWINPMTCGTPIGTYYLGDSLGSPWHVNFEIGQTSWNYAQVGYGTAANGTGYNWGEANWYENGEGSNKRVRRDIGGLQFTATGSWYVICQANESGPDTYTSASACGWTDSTVYPPASMAYFTVNALSNPTDVTAAKDGTHPATRVDLGWTQWNSKNVLITIATDTPSGSPTQGQIYSANDTIGNQTVVSGSQGGTSLEVTGLMPGQTYYFTFYSENYSYYSAGETAASVTMGVPQARNTDGGAVEMPAEIFLGDQNLIFGCDTWATLDGNWGRARMWTHRWPWSFNENVYGEWGDFTNAEHKACTPGAGVFFLPGLYAWGIQVDYGEPYGDNFWCGDDTAGEWLDMLDQASPLIFLEVLPLNDPTNQAAIRSSTDPSHGIDLSWEKDPQGHNVMVVRKLSTDSWTEPTQGTAYAVGTGLGSGTVVYNGSDTAYTNTGLSAGTTYDYKFYSENYSYYSAGVTSSATTAKQDQTIDFPPIYTKQTNDTVGLSATASSGLTVSFAVGSGPATITDGTNLSFTGTGTVSIVASQAGDAAWNPAPDVTNTFDVLVIPAGLVAWYPLDGNANDVVGSNHGTVTEATTTTDRFGQADAAYYFDGWGDYLTMTGASTEIQNSPISISLWFQSTGATETLLEVGEHIRNESHAQTGYGLLLDNGRPRFTVNRNPTAPFDYALWDSRKTAATYNDGNWHHVVCVFPADGATRVFMYVDGALASMMDVSGQAQSAIANAYTVHMTRLGDLTSVSSVPMSGRLDDVRFFNYVLNQSEVSALYQEGLPGLAVEINTTNVNVREAGEGRFFVRLNQDPQASVVVDISRSAGDASLTVQDGAQRSFNSANWTNWQAVTLVQAADDGNTDNETATFQVSLAGAADQFLPATALDDDIGENLALASGGSTITASETWYRPEEMIDGVHTSAVNYAWVITTTAPPGSITLDLKGTASVSRVRLLNWDWSYRIHRYQIESSVNGVDWSTLVDASGADRQGWDDWTIASQAARYLKFTGLDTSDDMYAVSIPELEVYGSRDLSFLPKPVLLKTNVNVRENGEGRIFVRLDKQPEGNVLVYITRNSGDAGITVLNGATRSFNAANWNSWQAVTLAEADDLDAASEAATIKVASPGVADQYVAAASLDDDIGTDLALASGGATITGSKASRPAQLIDGIHTVSTNYGYTIWTNVPAGSMTVDLKERYELSRVRLLNWDWVVRVHRYQIEYSENGTSWTTLVDASGEDRSGWDEWILSDEPARYLKFTGLSNSANQCVVISELEVYGTAVPPPLPDPTLSDTAVNVRENGQGRFFLRLPGAPTSGVVFTISRISGSADLTVQGGATRSFTAANWSLWQPVTLAAAVDGNTDGETAVFQISAPGYNDAFVTATALDDDIAENVALASGGATIAYWKGGQAAKLIDGIQTDSANYGWTYWNNVPPGTITLDMKAQMTVSRIRVLGWNWVYRLQGYQIEASTDGVAWSTIITAAAGRHGWDDWTLSDETIRYLRFTGLTNTANSTVCISELEVFGTRPPARRAPAMGAVAASVPVSVLTSAGPEDESGWNAVDGDAGTAWVGSQAGGGYLVVEYAPALTLNALEVDLAAGSLTGIEYLYSQDGADWQPLPEDLEAEPVALNFLWLAFPGDGTAAVPNVIEIRPNP